MLAKLLNIVSAAVTIALGRGTQIQALQKQVEDLKAQVAADATNDQALIDAKSKAEADLAQTNAEIADTTKAAEDLVAQINNDPSIPINVVDGQVQLGPVEPQNAEPAATVDPAAAGNGQ